MKYILIIVTLTAWFQSSSQNPDSTATVQFAKFLENSNLYKYAAEEYERLHFLYPEDDEILSKLLQNYRLAGLSDRIKYRYTVQESNPIVIKNYAINLIELGDVNTLTDLLQEKKNFIPDTLYWAMKIDNIYLQGDSKSAFDLASKYNYTERLNWINPANELRTKKPWLAGLLSSVVPGLGRAYTKDYANAIISLVFVGSTAFQAYRRFSKNGISSPTGWVYSGVGFGFYLGNIYGSYQSAKYYNKKQRKRIDEVYKSNIDLYYSAY